MLKKLFGAPAPSRSKKQVSSCSAGDIKRAKALIKSAVPSDLELAAMHNIHDFATMRDAMQQAAKCGEHGGYGNAGIGLQFGDAMPVMTALPHPTINFDATIAKASPQLALEVRRHQHMRKEYFLRPASFGAPYAGLLRLEDVAKEKDAHVMSYDPRYAAVYRSTQRPFCQPIDVLSHAAIQNLHRQLQQLGDALGLPLLASAGSSSGVVLAGGALLAMLHQYAHVEGGIRMVQAKHQQDTAVDVDMFVVVDHGAFTTEASRAHEATRIQRQVLDGIHRALPHGLALVVQRAGELSAVMTAYVLNVVDSTVQMKLQIIRRVYPTVTHVPHGFDIDCSGLVYDGKDVWATTEGARALASGCNLYDVHKLSPSAEFRYIKYLQRYGYGIVVIGVPDDVKDEVRQVSVYNRQRVQGLGLVALFARQEHPARWYAKIMRSIGNRTLSDYGTAADRMFQVYTPAAGAKLPSQWNTLYGCAKRRPSWDETGQCAFSGSFHPDVRDPYKFVNVEGILAAYCRKHGLYVPLGYDDIARGQVSRSRRSSS